MPRLLMLATLALTITLCTDSFAKPGATPDLPTATRPEPGFPGSLLISSGTASGLAARETTGPDTFVLYGGPDHPTEGKFQLADGITADWGGGNLLPGGYGGDPGAWSPVDLTYQRVYWHRDTYNAENLDSNGAGNHAMWCGLPAGDRDVAGWVNPQGYGNYWSDVLVHESAPVANVGVGQTVSLDFFLNYETEVDYDFVRVEYMRNAQWVEVASVTGTNHDGGGTFAAPGVRFSDIQTAPIEFLGNDYEYGGASGRIIIRIIFESDVAWSDEDGLFVSVAGAAQIDDITISHSEGVFFEDFEGAGPYVWRPDQKPFFGDFADVYPRFTDIDPCRENNSPVVGFIDYNQIVRNGPGATGAIQTGGEPYPGPAYGVPGNWATNHSYGLDGQVESIENRIISPEIEIDLPGTDDDDPAFTGYLLRFDAWEHRGLRAYGDGEIWYFWGVRTAMPGEGFGEWEDSSYYGFFAQGDWNSREFDLSGHVPPGAERIQVMLHVVNICQFIFFCDPNSAPAPVFDNVAVYKYRLPGPVLSMQTRNQAQDGFPVGGSIDTNTPASRDALDVPFSMARDINKQMMANVPGDSIVFEATPTISGSTITDLRMVWALQTNPLFEDALRSAPARTVDENVVAGAAGTVWTGEVVADSSRYSDGVAVQDWFFVDLPDADFMYPGDVLHHYFKATDSDGRVSTLPHDISSFGVFGTSSIFDRQFMVRALPTLTDASGTQPGLLVIDESWLDDDGVALTASLRQLGYDEGVDYDTYRVRAPTSKLGNGIGSAGAHGANAAQLDGYNHIIYLAGTSEYGLLSDGSETNDKGDDITTLENWHALGGARNVAYLGDYIATYHQEKYAATAAYLANTMGVGWISEDVSAAIGGQTAPIVTANPTFAPDLATSLVTYAGCDQLRQLDQIQPLAGASAGHYFTSAGGTAITDPSAGVASVVNSTASGVEITFPFSLSAIRSVATRSTGLGARTDLIAEILALFNAAPGQGVPVPAPELHRIEFSAKPNPFNPTTTVRFTARPGSTGWVKVFNLRGELVRTLHNGVFQVQEFAWDGVDDHGASVASGVYIVQAQAGGNTYGVKLALVK
ncbi:hypothetical protein DRQ32_04880 [bacterium]|nr:MAG: hypothetical protein DRQ32_04880 [bacterium]